MNNELYLEILDYLNSTEVEEKLQQILGRNLNEGQRENFLKIWQQIKDLEFPIEEIYVFLVWLVQDNFDKATKIDEELFEEILIDIYDELQELYEEKSQEPVAEEIIEETEPVAQGEEQVQQLVQNYAGFVKSSLWQNIVASQEQMQEKYGAGEKLKEMELKNEFYAAINARNQIKTVGILRLLAERGQLEASFSQDKRYQDFYGAYLERHLGKQEKENFLKAPQAKNYVIGFLRFVLERRLNFSVDQSAMIGASLAALCETAGETELGKMAFGDEQKGGFWWEA